MPLTLLPPQALCTASEQPTVCLTPQEEVLMRGTWGRDVLTVVVLTVCSKNTPSLGQDAIANEECPPTNKMHAHF